MENYTNFNDVQQSYLKLTDLGQTTHFPHIDFPSLPNPDTLQDLNSFPTDTHQINFDSTFPGGVSFSEQRIDQQDVTYSTLKRLATFHDLPSTPQTSPDDLLLRLSPPRDLLPSSYHIFSWLWSSQRDDGTKRSSSHTTNLSKDSHLNQHPSNNNWSGQGHADYVPVNNDDLFSCLDNSQAHSVGEQSSFSTYPGYHMATETPMIAAPIESGNTAGYRPKLQCSVPECSQDREFPSESALRKHEAKHNKSFICQVPNCKHTRFDNKGGLDRHSREVHGSRTHCCPITSCKRHVRGFPRKYNLFEHQKRCHSSQSPDLAPQSTPRQQNYINDFMQDQESYKVVSSADLVAGGGGRLREKLDNLYKVRAEIEVDIEAVKRSLNLLGEDSLR